MSALSKMIDQAFLQLDFAIKLLTYSELEKINKDEFDGEVEILMKSRSLNLGPNSFNTYDDIILAAQNNFTITLGFTAITLDQLLSEAGFSTDLPVNSPDRDLRALVFMIRSAFAHNMMFPRWKAVGPFAREMRINLSSGAIVVDTSKLNGKPFCESHIDGMEKYFEMKEEVKRMLSVKE